MKSEMTSKVLSRLLDSQRYDSRLRPNYAGKDKRRHTVVIYKSWPKLKERDVYVIAWALHDYL